jgi:hypothetical protein
LVGGFDANTPEFDMNLALVEYHDLQSKFSELDTDNDGSLTLCDLTETLGDLGLGHLVDEDIAAKRLFRRVQKDVLSYGRSGSKKKRQGAAGRGAKNGKQTRRVLDFNAFLVSTRSTNKRFVIRCTRRTVLGIKPEKPRPSSPSNTFQHPPRRFSPSTITSLSPLPYRATTP